MGGGEDVVHTDLKDGIWLVVKHAGIDNDEPAHSFVFCPSLQPQSGRPDFSCSSCSTTATPGPIILQKGITDADHRAFFVHGILAGEKKQQRAVRSLQPFSLPLPLAIAGNSLCHRVKYVNILGHGFYKLFTVTGVFNGLLNRVEGILSG